MSSKDEDVKTIGGILRARRKELGLSQTEVADLLDISFTSVSRGEKGIRDIKAGRLIRWMGVLGLRGDALNVLIGESPIDTEVEPKDEYGEWEYEPDEDVWARQSATGVQIHLPVCYTDQDPNRGLTPGTVHRLRRIEKRYDLTEAEFMGGRVRDTEVPFGFDAVECIEYRRLDGEEG